MSSRSLCALLFVLCATAADAQQLLTKVLVPVAVAAELPGAFGSRWITRMQVRNNGAQNIVVAPSPDGTGGCAITVCPDPVVPARQTVDLRYTAHGAYPNPGAFLYVTPGASTTFNVRIQDLSRQSLTWGTEIPVVREADTFTGTLTLIGIPTDDRFRVALRIYDFDGAFNDPVRLRVFAGDDTTPIAETQLALSSPSGLSDDSSPGYAQIGSLADAYPQLRSTPVARVEIAPLVGGMRIWAFASVTNDDTQHVTTIRPN